MAAGRPAIAAAVILICAAAVSVVAAQDAPAAGGCFRALVNAKDCLTYVVQGSNLTAPARACCPELAGLVESNLTCLCKMLGFSDSLGMKIDVNRMLELPSACDISTPPATLCSGDGGIDLIPVVDSPPGDQAAAPGSAQRTGTARSGSALVIVVGALSTLFVAS